MIFSKFLKILVVLLILTIVLYPYAQSLSHDKSSNDKSSYDKSSHDKSSSDVKKGKMLVSGDEGFFKKGYTRFRGNAYVEKGSVKMFADVIEYFETNNLALGKGNVKLFDYESGLNVTSKYSEYYGNSNVILFFDSPVLTISNKNFLLRGDVIVLDNESESILSFTNSYLSNGNVEVFSDSIKIFSTSNLIRLTGNSKVFSTNFTIYSDEAFIISATNKSTKELEIKRYVGIGKVVVTGSNFSLSSERIVINFSNGQLIDYIAFGGVNLSNDSTIVLSEYFRSQFYEGKDVLHIGMTNVVVSNLSSGDVLYSDYLISDKVNKYDLITGEKVYYIIKDSGAKVRAKVIERFIERKVVILKKDVVVETDNISVVGDIGKYDESTKILSMLGNPKVVSGDNVGVSASVITIDVESRSAKIENGSYGYVMQEM